MSDERAAANGVTTNAANQLGPSDDGAVTTQVAAETAAVLPSESVDPSGQPSPRHAETNARAVTAAPPSSTAEHRSTYFQATRAPRHSGMSSPVKASSVIASDCACKTNGSKGYAFVIGSLNYDFGTEARRDSFKLRMPPVTPNGLPYLEPYPPPDQDPPPGTFFPPNPYDARQMVNYLAGFPTPEPPFPTQGGFPALAHFPPDYPPPTPADPELPPFPESPAPFPPALIKPPKPYRGFPAQLSEATELIWTMNIELTPVYAIRPGGNFSTETYQRLVEFLAGQVRPYKDHHYVSRVSISGLLTGETVQLFSGQVVPVIVPYLRGMYAWNERQLILQVLKAYDVDLDSDEGKFAQRQLGNFLRRVYYELRNLGQTPQERALNYAATNVFQAAGAIIELSRKAQKLAEASVDPNLPVAERNKLKYLFELQSITVEPSPFCRIDSVCFDVFLKFFYPDNVNKARDLYNYTVDVSDPYPVSIGELRTWSVPT